ncbi:adenine-specific DNA methylase [Streptococcus suis]|uniref:adenine-specific DNA methylase n=1 Tax=Streptococcus suis TaxID=1307 RepID=UPI0025AF7054|nr:adenine-specific DNA methylase [Streptococcus suis]MDN2966437.1 adenine-specific DNA methylase [Streptococcus suis]MDN2983703.1 adenine-specific DNA methylase [Streptococcus suis]MDN2985623.1 adenine-specific DNA methylase [Streptococcus suis]
MIIERSWGFPSKNTFSIKPIAELLDEEVKDGIWIDPFANNSKIATITNDLNKYFDTDYHLDALDFLKMFEDASVDGVLYDPPYSNRQVSEVYKGVGLPVTKETTQSTFWLRQKAEIARILKPGGKVISFGWNSCGVGKKHNFEIVRILLVSHGGHHNDTIVTVEIKKEATND